MVDAPASGAGARKGVEVRVLSWAPKYSFRSSSSIRNISKKLRFSGAFFVLGVHWCLTRFVGICRFFWCHLLEWTNRLEIRVGLSGNARPKLQMAGAQIRRPSAPEKGSGSGGLDLLLKSSGGRLWRIAHRFAGMQKALAPGRPWMLGSWKSAARQTRRRRCSQAALIRHRKRRRKRLRQLFRTATRSPPFRTGKKCAKT